MVININSVYTKCFGRGVVWGGGGGCIWFRAFVLLVYDLIIALESFRLLPAKAFSVSKNSP